MPRQAPRGPLKTPLLQVGRPERGDPPAPRADSGRLYLGVDPGASGGLALVSSGGRLVACAPMPSTEEDVWDWVNDKAGGVMRAGSGGFAVIEQVGGFHRGGEDRQPGSAMFKFGQSYGGLRMALTAARIPWEPCTPAKWQRGLTIPQKTKQETPRAWKNRLKATAQRLFPGAHVTLATADAILIAEYCRRVREGRTATFVV